MSNEVEILGSFVAEEACAEGIEALHKAGLSQLRYFAPFPSERLLEAYGLDRSPVRRWALAAGITGVLSGFALTIGTSLTWSHVVGGKPIISIPPYIIISFELMILFAGITSVIATFALARLPQFDSLKGFSPAFASDCFGVIVRCRETEVRRAESILEESGAQEVRFVEAA